MLGGPPRPAVLRFVRRTAEALALCGGALLLAAALASVISIAGRGLFSAPLPGDYELVELACAAAVFLFLPYCHLVRGHVVVDFALAWAPRAWLGALDRVINLIFAAVSFVLLWRLSAGALDMARFGETSMILGIPLWLGFIPGVIGLATLGVVCLLRVEGGLDGDARDGNAAKAAGR